ncbi:MAG: hypothetical protein PWP56_229 [Acetobacterium sp.]|jgi:hypothetical protein|nr:hypothetical protein [Acetobacterium sp.]
MKPGNQRMYGANTCDIFAMMGFNVNISLVVRRGFFIINVRDYHKSDQVNGHYIKKGEQNEKIIYLRIGDRGPSR